MTTVEKLLYLIDQNVITLDQVAEPFKNEIESMLKKDASTEENTDGTNEKVIK